MSAIASFSSANRFIARAELSYLPFKKRAAHLFFQLVSQWARSTNQEGVEVLSFGVQLFASFRSRE